MTLRSSGKKRRPDSGHQTFGTPSKSSQGRAASPVESCSDGDKPSNPLSQRLEPVSSGSEHPYAKDPRTAPTVYSNYSQVPATSYRGYEATTSSYDGYPVTSSSGYGSSPFTTTNRNTIHRTVSMGQDGGYPTTSTGNNDTVATNRSGRRASNPPSSRHRNDTPAATGRNDGHSQRSTNRHERRTTLPSSRYESYGPVPTSSGEAYSPVSTAQYEAFPSSSTSGYRSRPEDYRTDGAPIGTVDEYPELEPSSYDTGAYWDPTPGYEGYGGGPYERRN